MGKEFDVTTEYYICLNTLTQHLQVDILLRTVHRLQTALGRRAAEVTEFVAHVQLPVHARQQIQRRRLAFDELAFGRRRLDGHTVEIVFGVALARQLRWCGAQQEEYRRRDQQRGDQQRGGGDGYFVHGRRCAEPDARRTTNPTGGKLRCGCKFFSYNINRVCGVFNLKYGHRTLKN